MSQLLATPYERVKETDPDRCKGQNAYGQCNFARLSGSEYCQLHTQAGRVVAANKAEDKSYYRFKFRKDRVDAFANSSAVKELREEIGIVKMMIEEVLGKCETAEDLMLYTDRISGLVEQARKLIESAQKLEIQNSQLLDRDVVVQMAQHLVNIIGEYVTDPATLQLVGSRFLESIVKAASPKHLAGFDEEIGNAAKHLG